MGHIVTEYLLLTSTILYCAIQLTKYMSDLHWNDLLKQRCLSRLRACGKPGSGAKADFSGEGGRVAGNPKMADWSSNLWKSLSSPGKGRAPQEPLGSAQDWKQRWGVIPYHRATVNKPVHQLVQHVRSGGNWAVWCDIEGDSLHRAYHGWKGYDMRVTR